MYTVRQVPGLSLEDALLYDYDEKTFEASDDELDEAVRAAKRRRIEILGESYLRGKPLFIASASLRGPFEGGWANPWKKHRKSGEAGTKFSATTRQVNGLVEDTVPDTDSIRVKKIHQDRIISPGGLDPQENTASPRSPPYSEGRLSNPFYTRESSSSHVGRLSDVQPTENWLKRNKSTVDIRNYEPPKSPSPRYDSSRAKKGIAKASKVSRKHARPGVGRATKTHQTDLRNVRRIKPVSGDSQNKQLCTKSSRILSVLNRNEEPGCVHSDKEKEEESLESKTEDASERSLEKRLENVDFSAAMAEPGPRKTSPNDHQIQAASPVQTRNSTLGMLQNKDEILSESEGISSAQIVPKQPGPSTYFISLHSTEIRGVIDNGGVHADGELSTQAAFDLAQKSFQDNLNTPNRDFQELPKAENGSRSSNKSIIPFANINASPSMSNIKIGSNNIPGTTHSIDTQAMIDAFSPFIDSVGENPVTETREKSSQSKQRTDFIRSLYPLARSKSLDNTSFKEMQNSKQYSFPPLPFTLSGTTPPTNQQDGQGFHMDAFDVSQAIQDVGSWLQQSWDVKSDLKRYSERNTQSSPTTHG